MPAPTDPLSHEVAMTGFAVDRLLAAGGRDPEALGMVQEGLERIRVLVAALPPSGQDGIEIERKYLLRSLPPVAGAVPPDRIEQGYLPGERLVERVRRVTAADGTVRGFRTVKAGEGVARLEIEEETSPELLDALWPLTAGRRVLKERHVVDDGGLRWEVDRFTDRELALAEVELPDAATEPALPAWLAPYVVREVTGERAYVNAVLAR